MRKSSIYIKNKGFFSLALLLTPVLVVLALAGGYYMINFKPQWIPEPLTGLVRQAELTENPNAERCSECHQTIFESWKKSRHSLAWVSKFFIEDSENRTKEKCLPCHIPQVVKNGEKPSPRLTHRDDGVYCVPCHLVDGAMNGPHDLYAPPHPTKLNEDYRKSKICGSCHEKTYKEWQNTGHEKTCQSCHMPASKNRLVQKFFLGWLHAPKKTGDHSFPRGDVSEENLKVNGRFLEGNRFSLGLLNTSVPHFMPTADNGDPRLYAVLTLFDAKGEQLDRYKEIIAPQQETALPFNKEVTFIYPLFGPVSRAELLIQYRPAWSKEKQEILTRTFEKG